MNVCSCASPMCAALGCQIANATRQKYGMGMPGPQPVQVYKEYPKPDDGCKPVQVLTESDVRRIVAEEVAKALAPYAKGLTAHIQFGGSGA